MSGLPAMNDRGDFDELLQRYIDAPPGAEREAALQEFAKVPRHVLETRATELKGRLHNANEDLAGALNKLALFNLAVGRPSTQTEPFRPEAAGAEVALAALAILRRTGRSFDPTDNGAAIDDPELPPQFSSCAASSDALGAHLKTAAYFLLNADASHDALASEPPLEEVFPPLPFPQVWIEMAHLSPYAGATSGMVGRSAPAATRPRSLPGWPRT